MKHRIFEYKYQINELISDSWAIFKSKFLSILVAIIVFSGLYIYSYSFMNLDIFELLLKQKITPELMGYLIFIEFVSVLTSVAVILITWNYVNGKKDNPLKILEQTVPKILPVIFTYIILSLGLGILFVLLILPVFLGLIWWAFVLPIVVIRGKILLEALKYSKKIASKKIGEIIAYGMIFLIITQVPNTIISMNILALSPIGKLIAYTLAYLLTSFFMIFWTLFFINSEAEVIGI